MADALLSRLCRKSVAKIQKLRAEKIVSYGYGKIVSIVRLEVWMRTVVRFLAETKQYRELQWREYSRLY